MVLKVLKSVLFAIHRIGFLSTREKLLLSDLITGNEQFAALSLSCLSEIVGRKLKTLTWDPRNLLRCGTEDLEMDAREGISWTWYWDQEFPPLLREIYDPPFLLYYRGILPDNEVPALGIVGTRYPTGAGRKAALRLGFEAAKAGLTVVSGLALGIDAEAHEGALRGDGKTVAVLGNGVSAIYPGANRSLGRQILLSGGCIMSEFPPETPPLRYNFPKRNRLISGLSRGSVVVEAPEKSGALITADFALEQGRDLFVHRDGLAGSAGAGGRKYAVAGAMVVEGMEDILKEWGVFLKSNWGQIPGGAQFQADRKAPCQAPSGGVRRAGASPIRHDRQRGRSLNGE